MTKKTKRIWKQGLSADFWEKKQEGEGLQLLSLISAHWLQNRSIAGPSLLLANYWYMTNIIAVWWRFKNCMSVCPYNLAEAKLTTLVSHSALRRSNTTALQQLPVGDHGGRMNTQMKGSAVGGHRLSARLKKWEALRPHTSARPSSLSNADGEKDGTSEVLWPLAGGVERVLDLISFDLYLNQDLMQGITEI